MKKMTKENLENAFAGESQAYMKYVIFADQAEEEGLSNVARMFRAIAHAELVHARNHLKALGKVGSTVENLKAAKGGEDFEIHEMYPAYKEVAQSQGESEAVRTMHFALVAEKEHSEMYGEAIDTLAETDGEDIELGDVWVCPVCGYTAEGDNPPEKCPVSGTDGDRFGKF